MARPRKNNADYFSHDADMRNDDKVKAIRNQHGIEGYAIWCMMLETLADADGFKIVVDELTFELLSGDFGTTPEKLEDILNSFRRLKLIVIENDLLFAPGLIQRMQPLLSDRAKKRAWAAQQQGNSTSKKENSTSKTPQSKDKVKVSKDTKKKGTRKKPSAKPLNLDLFDVPENLRSEKFTDNMTQLINSPKWINKPKSAIQSALNQISRYDVGFAIRQVESAISGNWQGLVFSDTDVKYSQWLKINSPGPSPNGSQKGSRASVNNLGSDRETYDQEQAF